MTLDRATMNARRGAQLEEELRVVSRERWIDGTLTALKCVGSCMVGLFFLGLAVHVTDYQLGMVYFWTGLILGDVGMIVALTGYYRRGEERGQW